MHVGQHNLRPRPIIYNHAQQSGCGCGSALPEGPRHLLVGYGNVAVNRQQHSYNYPEGGKDWSVSGIVSFAAQFILTISPSLVWPDPSRSRKRVTRGRRKGRRVW